MWMAYYKFLNIFMVADILNFQGEVDENVRGSKKVFKR